VVLAVVNAQRYPGATWERATPESQGMSNAKIQEAFDYAERWGDGVNYCVTVHRNGYLIAERSWNARNPPWPIYPYYIWSVSKAFTATLIGSAERDGILNTEDLSGKYIAAWRNANDGSERITLDMIMRHDSGRYYDFFTDFIRSQWQPSQTDFAIGLRQQHPPGTLYQYNQMAIQTLERVIVNAVNQTVNQWARAQLFGPLQFEETETEYQEKSIVIPISNDPLMYGGVRTSCSDLGRFGHLWLNRGQWSNNRTIFTDAFYVKATSYPQPPRAGRAYHWGGYPNIKAQGMGKQFVTFNPEKNLVLTRIGNPTGAGIDVNDYIAMMMDAFIDGDKGSYVYDHNAPDDEPEEEKQAQEMLRMVNQNSFQHYPEVKISGN